MHEFGVYSDGEDMPLRDVDAPTFTPEETQITGGLPIWDRAGPRPGQCIPWETKRPEVGPISGDEQLMRDVWSNVDALGNMFIWQCLVSF